MSNGVLYDQGEDTDGIFIVKSGTFQVHSIIEIDNFRQYPISQMSWEIERITTSVKSLMGTLKEGSIFGYLEILNKSKIRMNRVSTSEVSTILYLSEANFKDLFDEQDMSELILNPEIKTAQAAVDDIISSNNWKLFKKKAQISAAKNINKKAHSSLDFIPQNYEIDKYMSKLSDPNVKKLINQDQNHEIVKVKKSRKVVGDAYYLETNKLNIMSTRRVRFSSSFYHGD